MASDAGPAPTGAGSANGSALLEIIDRWEHAPNHAATTS